MNDTGEQASGDVTVRRGWRRWANRFLLACGVVFLMILGCAVYFHERIVDSIFKNVAYVTDGEMPVSVTSYPSGPEIAGIIGGSGEGLNCSLPPLADLFFEDGDPRTGPRSGSRHLVRQKFRQACVFHDLCYRHGLATYGYSQNDCDHILQEHAHRLCEYLPKENKTGDQCQLDAKKVLAGVSLGGFGSYRGWDRSTFFEFDAHPLRSQRFQVSRVVDHPFKALDAGKYQDESQQVILTFDTKRSDVRVRCANCGPHNILKPAPDVTPELVSAGMAVRPAALVGRSLDLDGNRTVWLPPWRDHAAPHVLADAAGKQWIVWTTRSESQNTMVCMVVADAARLLTYTLPHSTACSRDARSTLRLEEFDVLSSAPQPGMSPQGVVTTGLTRQLRDMTTLDLCRWPQTPAASKSKKTWDCARLETAPGQGVSDLGAFQGFPIIKSDRHIYVSRAISDDAALQHKVTFRDRVFGDWHSSKGRFLILSNPYDAGSAEDARTQRVTSVPFDIADQYDPMVPLSRVTPDNRLLSLVANDETVRIFLIDAAKSWTVPAPIATRMNNAELALHKSWASRPVLVVETSEQGAMKSQLVFSRSLLAPAEQEKRETVLFEVLLMERGLSEPAEKPYEVAASAVCKISYAIRNVRDKLPCSRTFAPDRLMRASPGAMLQGGQMLAGRFNREGRLALALPDACSMGDPIIFNRSGEGGRTFTASQKPPPPTAAKRTAPNVQRTVECVPSKGPAGISPAMNAAETLALFK